ncbi:VTT domain-containing protein [Acinetobacter nectaris]|uniref:VTT domain-containing protein n=1 Tax=Acinetobacter nectaris TaxID=1219382 RepID=UPI001F1FF0A5|nr:VTT domain-containing protein [Acinetobacter nectaris]MCF9034655.1 VTT domain-containing protein [Acinetobacter nectaris]
MSFFDFILSFENHLPILIQEYGMWIYAILFLIIFAETAFIFMFFLPGDSLLLTIGALCATTPLLNLNYMIFLLFIAATLGYIVNYHIGKVSGNSIINSNSRFVKKEYLHKTEAYFAKHGGKTILLARFIPFARSFAPFAAGSTGMNYFMFLIYNIIGAFIWIALLVGIGYMFASGILTAVE